MALSTDRIWQFYTHATAWNMGDVEDRPDLELLRERQREEFREWLKEERGKWLRVFADAPEGWYPFGYHAHEVPPEDMEFWGEDPDDGMPLLERPARLTTVYRFHQTYPDMPDLWHGSCTKHPDFAPCDVYDRVIAAEREHLRARHNPDRIST